MKKPFKILEKVKHLFKLELLCTIKVSLVFYASKLRKAATNLLKRQLVELLELEEIDEEIK